MSSIIGYVNVKNSKEKIISGLEIMHKRGVDGIGLYQQGKASFFKEIRELARENVFGEVVFAHNLFSREENIKQPTTTTTTTAPIIDSTNSIIVNKKQVFLSDCRIYNYKELSSKHKIDAKNDVDFLSQAIIKGGKEILNEVNGPYAVCLYDGKEIYLRRDLLGIKPLWYAQTGRSFGFASEKKVLEKTGFEKVIPLNPREELNYNVEENKITLKKIPFYKATNKKTTKEEIYDKLKKAVLLRARDHEKIGLLYSSGIDSLIIAKILKDNQIPFKAYFAYALDVQDPKDLSNVLRTEKEYGFEIERVEVTKKEIKEAIPLLLERVESSNPVKIGVALPVHFASLKAKEDGCKVILSGFGSDEIFAGYAKFKDSKNLSKDTLEILLQMHETDLYRENVVVANNGLEERFPYLDKEVLKEALLLEDLQKLNKQENKIILREIGKEISLLEEDYKRKKIAAQYGSGFDKMIEKISKENKFKNKGDFLESVSQKEKLLLGCLYSGGKDSNLAYHLMKEEGYKIVCLMTMITENPDSYMFQKIDEKILSLQSEALEVPFVLQKTKGVKEEELKDLKKLITKAKEKYSLKGIISGAIKSNYQKDRIQEICDELELELFSPLWNKTQESVLKEVIENQFQAIMVKIAGAGLDKTWLGKRLTKEDLINLKIINKKKGINIAGEGGEYESIVLNMPHFKKRIKITSANPIMENEFTGYLDILKIEIHEKEEEFF